MLQDLCPRCGADWLDGARACPVCGFDPIGLRVPAVDDTSRGVHVRPMDLAWLTLAMVALIVVALGAGWRLGSASVVVQAPQPDVAGSRAVVPVTGELGRVRFAERLGESLELEAYRTQFTAGDTIAWRAEFLRPPPTRELRLVISWVSHRERMQLSETTVMLPDAELAMVARDEVPLEDLVPTAGLYEVRYFAGDVKLAEGVFELLPSEESPHTRAPSPVTARAPAAAAPAFVDVASLHARSAFGDDLVAGPIVQSRDRIGSPSGPIPEARQSDLVGDGHRLLELAAIGADRCATAHEERV